MPAEMVVVKGRERGEYLALEPGTTKLIGRAANADLRLRDDKKVSSEHARIECRDDNRCFIEDLGSTNGTYVNGQRIQGSPLRAGDRVKIGNSLIVFREDGASVHLSDLALRGGGSSGDIGAALGPTSAAPSPAQLPGGPAAPEGAGAVPESFEGALERVALALASTSELRPCLDRALEVALSATGASRAILFLRDPVVGGLGCAAAVGRQEAREGLPVDPDVLRRAVSGEVASSASEAGAAAVPIRAADRVAGALYLDAPGRRPVTGEGRFLAAVAGMLSLALRSDRMSRLTSAACEILEMAQEPARRGPVPLEPVVAAAVRLFEPATRGRGLAFEQQIEPGVVVTADPVLLGRSLDRTIEAALISAKAFVRVTVEKRPPYRAALIVSRGGPLLQEAQAQEVLDPDGPAGDLRRAMGRGGDGVLALASASAARAGGRLLVEPAGPRGSASFVIELPLADAAPAS